MGLTDKSSVGTTWSPVQGMVINAGVGQRTLSPCEGTDEADCVWAQPQPPTQNSFAVGASWQPVQSLSLSVDYREAAPERNPVFMSGDGFNVFVDSQDLSLSCELDTESWGNLELGLQLSRWAQGVPANTDVTDPYASAALDVGWRWRSFRGGLTGRSTQLLGGERADAWNTVDLDFAWRTPWNASLSVGARNLLNEPAPANSVIDSPGTDDFLGRVPYVRYKQDL